MFDTNSGIEQEGIVIDDTTEISDLTQSVMDNTEDSDPEKTKGEATLQPTEQTQSSEGDNTQDVKLPFHEDPKVQDYIARQVEKRIESELSDFRSFKERVEPIVQQNEQSSSKPMWFAGDDAQWNDYVSFHKKLAEEAETNAIRKIEQKTTAEQQRVKEANEWFEQNVKEFETQGQKVDRNKLLKTAMDYELIDSKGRWNYKAAQEIVRAKEPQPDMTERKKITQVNTDQGQEPKVKDVLSHEDLKNRGWFDY